VVVSKSAIISYEVLSDDAKHTKKQSHIVYK